MKKTMIMTTAVAMLLLAGCGEKECFFVSQDCKVLKEGAKVVWAKNNVPVGRIVSLKEVEDGTRATIRFSKKYSDFFHDGVAGRVVVDQTKSPPVSAVVLFGGGRTDCPLLENGDEIPESKFESKIKDDFVSAVEWLATSRVDNIKVIGYALAILLVLLKFGAKTLRFVAVLGFVVAVIYVCVTANIDWNRHKERFAHAKETAIEAKAWLQQHGEKLHAILDTALEADD